MLDPVQSTTIDKTCKKEMKITIVAGDFDTLPPSLAMVDVGTVAGEADGKCECAVVPTVWVC